MIKINNPKLNLRNKIQSTLFSRLALTGLLTASIASCTTEQINESELSSESESYASQSISITNFDFEDGKDGWSDEDEIAVSSIVSEDEGTLDGGKKSIKISSSGDRVAQIISVSSGTSYVLSAIISGKGSIGVG